MNIQRPKEIHTIPFQDQKMQNFIKNISCWLQAVTNIYFTGRLATYKYYNMDQVVAQSLTLFKKIVLTGK